MTNKKSTLYIFFMAVFIDWMSIGLVYPMFSSMLYDPAMGLLPAEATSVTRGMWLGVLLSVMPLTQFFTSAWLGGLSDFQGRKTILTKAMGSAVVGYAIATLAVMCASLWLLLVSRFLIGIAAGSGSVVSAGITDICTDEDKGKNFGLVNAFSGIGFTAGPFLGGFLSSKTWGVFGHFTLPFLFAGIASLVNWLAIAFILKETLQHRKKGKVDLLKGIYNLTKATKMEGLRRVFLSIFILAIGWSFFWEFIPVTWISQFSFSAKEIGNVYAFGAACYALGSGVLLRFVLNKWKAEKVLGAGLYLTSFAIFAMLFPYNPKWVWVFVAVQQIVLSTIFPCSYTIVSDKSPKDSQGEALGILGSVESGAFGISPMLAGVALGISALSPLIVGGGCMLIAAVIYHSHLKSGKKSVG